MSKTLSDRGTAGPLLDIVSYARRGPGQRDRLSPEEIQLIERTVRRTPEVMVKVLSRGGQDAKSVGRHFAYLSRKGNLEIETDDGRHIEGKGAEAELLEDWDLDIQEQRPTSTLGAGLSRKLPKLVHKVLFSMPPGTPPKKVLEAVKVLAREEFGAKHRYAMVVHTDEPHPHVHMVVKAVSEDGFRLNIRKATLQDWRREFARHLREQGVSANATTRAVRGEARAHKPQGTFHAALRGVSRVSSTGMSPHSGSHMAVARLRETRKKAVKMWYALRSVLDDMGEARLAGEVERFVSRMPTPSADHRTVGR